MRAVLTVGSLAALIGACMSAPQLEPLTEDPQGTLPSPPPAAPDGSPVVSSEPDAARGPDATTDGAVPPADASKPDGALPPLCSPPGAPPGTACCGPGGKLPACIGIACAHCGDCLVAACPAGNICCATLAGNSGNYKSMGCAAPGAAGACP